MYNVGYFSLLEKKEDEKQERLATNYYHIHSVKEEQLHVVEQLDVLLLEDSKPANFSRICELLLKVRQKSNILVWVLSDNDSEVRQNRLIYLKLGADGVVDHTDNWDELSLILKNAIDRNHHERLFHTVEKPKKLVSSPSASPFFQLVHSNLSVIIENGEEVSLTKLEFMAIEYLYKNAKNMVTYEEIYQSIWDDSFGSRKYRVSNLIFHLRKKIQPSKSSTEYIKTVRSKGYILKV